MTGSYLGIDIIGLDKALASVDRLADGVQAFTGEHVLLQQALTKSALALQGKVKELAPVRTGTLRRSITAQVNTADALVGTNLHYAPYLEYGTKDHGPKSSDFLHFKIDGEWVRTKHVRGIKPMRFFHRAVESVRETVEQHFRDAVAAILRSSSS